MDQLKEIEKDVGADDESIRVHILGGRPLMAGEHFPTSIQALIRSEILDQKMEHGLLHKMEGYKHIEYSKVGTVLWETPYEPDRSYCVIADPGTDNPPNRNAAVIMVWDYTDFPKAPATLAAFAWVYGNHRPEPWIEKFIDYTINYHAIHTNAIDSTAWQSGIQESLYIMDGVTAGGLSLQANNKARYLNFAKRMAGMGLMKMPSIQGAFTQLGRYKLPDIKLKQDIVMTFIMSAGWLEHLYYFQYDDEEAKDKPIGELPEGRYLTEEDRFAGGIQDSRWN
jgi:hypothetical protein